MSYCSRFQQCQFTVLDLKSCGHFLLLMNFQCKFRHHRSIPRPRFPYKVRNFGEVFHWFFLHFIYWRSAIFLLPVCLAYWPRKYTTRVDPRGDNFRQVWSWYDDLLLSYNVPHWFPLKMRTRTLRMRWITWAVSKRSGTITFLEYPNPICLFTIQLFGTRTTIKGRWLLSCPMLMPFAGEKICPVEMGPKKWRFSGKMRF